MEVISKLIMDYKVILNKEINILKYYGININLQTLFDENVIFMFEKAITNKVLDKKNLTYQSTLYL